MDFVVWKFMVVFWSAIAVDKNNVILTHGQSGDESENNEEKCLICHIDKRYLRQRLSSNRTFADTLVNQHLPMSYK